MPVVMLSGPVGAGKTTVAQELVRISPAPLCYIEGDTFWPVFKKPDAKPQRERFRLLMRSLTAAAVPLARGGYEVLLDFSFPLNFLETARKILKEIPLDFVIVRPSMTVCEQRSAERPEGKIADYGVYREFYAMFEGLPEHEINDDHADAGSIAQRIREGLDAGIFRLDSVIAPV
jgi:chloramphenicol 3-O-phosphotransferase